MPIEVACHLNVVVPDLAEPALSRSLAALAGLGYSHVVLPPIDPDTAPLSELAAVFRDHGLAPITLGGQAPGADVSSADPDEREQGAAALRRLVAATVALGGDQMNGVSYGLFGRAETVPTPEAVERAAQAVGQVAEHAHAEGVAMTFEVLNRYETAMLNTAEQALAFIAASGSEHLQVHLDTFHMAVEESDMLGAVRSAVPVLGYLELGQSGRGPLSTGVVDTGAVVQEALRAGYRGRVGVEAFSRSVLSSVAGDVLAIWRAPYTDGLALAAEAIDVVRAAEAAVGSPDGATR
ncbi:sugar phosphate isomerase/epimerase family protein [Modestobacter versicolor]|uniref:sugar phosphate isomerase/epimerase family protein n=1 Tax=Modestobacter versicolor TaxID=429133 RepID=UPI0034DDE8B7